MLYLALNRGWFFLAASAPLLATAQLTIDKPVVMTGTEESRRIEGLSLPTSHTDLLTVEASLIGTAHWSDAVMQGNVILLTPAVELPSYRTGQLLRFIAPAAVHDSVLLACLGSDALPLVRPDGIRPVHGQIGPGSLCEVMNADDRWILMNLPERGCPAGTLQVTERLCMETTTAEGLLIFAAAERCTDMGGRLCSWGEFHFACVEHGEQLGMGTAWEWTDDTSNHKHGGVVVGQTGCTSERWAQATSTAKGRCCFEPR